MDFKTDYIKVMMFDFNFRRCLYEILTCWKQFDFATAHIPNRPQPEYTWDLSSMG